MVIRMDGQINLFEYMSAACPCPPMWDCMKTCRHYLEFTDSFPIRSHGVRCMYGILKDGTSGHSEYEKMNSIGEVTLFCKYYERKNTLVEGA